MSIMSAVAYFLIISGTLPDYGILKMQQMPTGSSQIANPIMQQVSPDSSQQIRTHFLNNNIEPELHIEGKLIIQTIG